MDSPLSMIDISSNISKKTQKKTFPHFFKKMPYVWRSFSKTCSEAPALRSALDDSFESRCYRTRKLRRSMRYKRKVKTLKSIGNFFLRKLLHTVFNTPTQEEIDNAVNETPNKEIKCLSGILRKAYYGEGIRSTGCIKIIQKYRPIIELFIRKSLSLKKKRELLKVHGPQVMIPLFLSANLVQVLQYISENLNKKK